MVNDKLTPKVGEVAPDFSLTDYQGISHSLSEIRGDKPVLLLFFRGTFCPDCRRQMGFLKRNHERLEAMGVQIVAVARQHYLTAQGYFKLEPTPITFLLDMEFRVSGRYGMVYDNDWQPEEYGNQLILPGLFALDGAGVIRYAAVDLQWDTDGSFEQALASLNLTPIPPPDNSAQPAIS